VNLIGVIYYRYAINVNT